jgi:hypothetical protein
MTTVSTSEAIQTLPELMERSRSEKVAIRDLDGSLVYLVPSQPISGEQLAKVAAFETSRNALATELVGNLAKEGITVEEFVEDLLRD